MRSIGSMSSLVVFGFASAVFAHGGFSFEGKDFKNSLYRLDGLTDGKYYIQCEMSEQNARSRLRHKGRIIDFTRGGPWFERDGRNFMVYEAGPLEVKNGDVFEIPPNTSIGRVTISEKPLAFAPQKLFSNLSESEHPYSFDISYGNGEFTVVVRNTHTASARGNVSIVMTDYWQREVARLEQKGVDITEKTVFKVPCRENRTGYSLVRVEAEDVDGFRGRRLFARVGDRSGRFRDEMALNRGWERTCVKDDGTRASRVVRQDPPAEAKWRTVEMPAEIAGSLAWFRSERVVPSSFSGRRIFFKVSRLVGDGDLYIDGAKAACFGADFNYNGLQEADVTEFVKPGVKQQYLLALRSSTLHALPDEELDKKVPDVSKARAHTYLKSACGELSIEARPENAIGKVMITTSFRDKTVSVKAEHPEGFTVRNAVWFKDEKKLEFGESSKWNDPVLWGPFDFPLLRMESSLVDADGKVVDVKETRFGFREFWSDKMAMMWNGHHVRGDARAFGSTWGWSFDSRCKRQSNVDMLCVVKEKGVKFLRHIYSSSEYIDYCDELGIPIAKGGMTPSGPTPEKSANDEFWKNKEYNDRRMIETLYNHPSIMTWYISNEYYGESEDIHWKRISSAVRNALACDPTRYAEGGCDIDVRKTSNVISTHYPVEFGAFRNAGCFMPYCFYWRPVDKRFEEGMRVPFGQVKTVCNVFGERAITWGERPICVNETCWDHFFAPPFGFTRIAGDDVFNQVYHNVKWHIETDKEAVRGHRDAEATLWTTWRWFYDDPVNYVSPEVDVVPIQRYAHFYEGTKVSYDVNAFYDVWKADRLVWFWRLEDMQGRLVMDGGEQTREVDCSALFREKVEFAAPPPGRYVLKCGFRGMREVSWPVRTYARKAYVRPSNVFSSGETLSEDLLERAAAGETIVVLARENYPDWLPEMMALTEQSGAILRTFRPSHPILAGVEEDELHYFYPCSVASRRAFMKPSAGNARTVLEFGGMSGLTYSALVEVPYGKGCFIYSRLVLEPDLNPVAAKLLENMSAYRRESKLGRALFIGDDDGLAKALREKCNAHMDEGSVDDVAKYAAVFLDGARRTTDEELKSLENCGRTVFVFSPNPQYGIKTLPVKAKDSQGRAVRVGRDRLMEGLTNQDLMWRTKYDDPKKALMNMGDDELVVEDGALLYPVYLARRGNFVFVTADPRRYNVGVASLQKRFWATLFGNAGVEIEPFSRPTLPKNLFYEQLDVSELFTHGLYDKVDNDGKGAWNDQGPERCLPMKFKHPVGWVGGVPFAVKKGDPCAFVLYTENRKYGESNVVVKVGRRADTLHWLYCSAWSSPGKRHFSVHLRYEDGTSATVHAKGRVNTADWGTTKPDFSEETDTVSGYRVFKTGNQMFPAGCVLSMSYVNPHPEKIVQELEFERGEPYCACTGFFAVTLGHRRSEYANMPPEEKLQLHKRLVDEALAAQRGGEPLKAVDLYEKALRVMPEKVWVYRSIGEIYESLEDWDYALEAYRRSLEADFNQPDIWEAQKRVKSRL